jgi:hypothetical protein
MGNGGWTVLPLLAAAGVILFLAVRWRRRDEGGTHMSESEFREAEKQVVREMKRIAAERPETAEPSVTFKRDWAYGNAGLEDETITREQVQGVIKD